MASFQEFEGQSQQGYGTTQEVNNPHKLGTGTLYHISIDYGTNGKSDIKTITFYEKSLGDRLRDFDIKSLFAAQYIVFGSGGGSTKMGSEPDYSKPISTIDYKRFKSLFEFLSLGTEGPEQRGPLNDATKFDKATDLASKLYDQTVNPDPEDQVK